MSKRPRKASKSTSSSSQPFDSTKFVSFQAFEGYKKLVVTKSFVQQRGFQNPGSLITGQIARRGWGEFTKTPIPAILPVVREFYANAKEHKDKTVFVRGKRVSFAQPVINQYYGLQEIDDTDFQQYRAQPDFAEIISELTEGTVEWKLTANGKDVLRFPSAGLGYATQTWHNFISANILPSRHISEVTKERAILNYAIQEDYAINIGSLIEQSILDTIAGKTTGGLGHSALIYGLCLQKNVAASDEEEVLQPKADMTWEIIQRYKRTAGDAAQSSQRRRQYHPPEGTQPRAQRSTAQADMNKIQQTLEQVLKQQSHLNTQRERMEMKIDRVLARQARLEAYQLQTVHYLKTGFQALAGNSFINFPSPPATPPLSPDQEKQSRAHSASTSQAQTGKAAAEEESESKSDDEDSDSEDESADSEE